METPHRAKGWEYITMMLSTNLSNQYNPGAIVQSNSTEHTRRQKEHANHLKQVIKQHYQVTYDWTETFYIGISLY